MAQNLKSLVEPNTYELPAVREQYDVVRLDGDGRLIEF